jgi:hypothetical protein
VEIFLQDNLSLYIVYRLGWTDGYKTHVHQLHVSKTSFIKPHVDPLDMEASLFTWFTKGEPNGGIIWSISTLAKNWQQSWGWDFCKKKHVIHGTFLFESISIHDHVLGVATVNKTWLHTKLQNQVKEGVVLTLKNN